jgi:hypothetical protein
MSNYIHRPSDFAEQIEVAILSSSAARMPSLVVPEMICPCTVERIGGLC